MRLATLQFQTNLQKCIRMGITMILIFISGGITSDIRSKIMFFPLCSRVVVKLNSRPYIRRYTSPNENFKYSYPLNNQLSVLHNETRTKHRTPSNSGNGKKTMNQQQSSYRLRMISNLIEINSKHFDLDLWRISRHKKG